MSKSFRDRRLFLILIPCINVITYYLTYTHLPPGWLLPLTFVIDTLEGYAAWWVFRQIIRYLDGPFPYERSLWKRVVLQCTLTVGVGIGIIIALTELVNAIATDKPVPSSFYTHDIFIISIWILVVNGIYIGAYFYYRLQQIERSQLEDSQPAPSLPQPGLVVRLGKQSDLILYEQMAGFCVEDEYTILVTDQAKRYVLDQSLDKLEETLPAQSFFRLNRQYLLHRQIIAGFARLENGKLSVRLNTGSGIADQVSVSRTKAMAFKKWFSPDEITDSSPVISLHLTEKQPSALN
ncbi:LytTR family transcriptional regulator [Fibrisoma montanum]|uniref:LytTR family transcriptional regulator n=1 Tax=Fibrisoma montanum TaxID=2305895 RepID=A0A418LZZ1_9BACT|nr:LytTR family DNA-binding domain-containing protein [Fibrisoma montanum]RIV18982.1 LytTR family transcriptional regulator [Fibrisoma montanum]